MTKYYKSAMKYFAKHTEFNALVHAISGVGVGILITYPFVGAHPLRVGAMFVVIGLLGHAWAATHRS